MYEQVFHFSSRPFTSTPFVKHYFSGDSIDHSLGQAKLCIDRASGPVMVVGGAGTGKSLFLALLEDQYHSQFNVVNLACAKMEQRRDLLQSILFELKQPYQGLTDAELRFALMEYLNPSDQCPNGVLLLIDEAHLLSQEMLDEVRLITNFVREGEPRVRVVLAGNQRLEENLSEPKLESFNQRIAARCYLSNMTRDETAQYVVEHVERAGGSDLFDKASLKAIHEVSDGCPRLVNQVCDHALILAATRGESVIGDQCVLEAWADVQSIPGDWAAPATQPASASEMQNDESWTVIEFGQLDDSDQPAEQGTTCDFENSQSAGESTSFETGDESDAEFVSESIQAETELESEESEIERQQAEAIEADSSSAASNTSEADQWHEDKVDATEDQPMESSINNAEGELSLEPELDLAPSEESESNHEPAQALGEEPDDETFQPIDDFANHSADDMEAQLNAVFGDGLNSTEPGDEKEISEMEAEQEALLDEVEAATQEADSEEASLSVNEQLAAAISQFTNEPSDSAAAQRASVESNLSDALEDQDADVESEPPSHYQGEDSYVTTAEAQPEPNDDSPSDDLETDQAPLANHISNETEGVENREPSPDLSSETQAWSDSNESEPVGETDDPFAEEFLEEEHLVDRYAPFVAHQNQSSLSLTSSDLAMIRPLDSEERETADDSQDAISQDVEPAGPLASSDRDDPAPTSPTVDIIEAEDSEAVASLENDSESSAAHDTHSDNESPHEFGQPDIDLTSTIAQLQEDILNAEEHPPEDIQQTIVLDQAIIPTFESGLSTADYDAALQAADQSFEQPTDDDAEPTETDSGERRSELTTDDSPSSNAEIERQAEEILHRLGISQNVSCETEAAEASATDSVSPDSSRETEPTVMLHASEDRQETVPQVAISDPTLVLDNETADPTDFERQSAALDETQQILNEILAQKNILASQRLESEFDESSASNEAPDDFHESSETPSSTEAEQEQPPTDDREMIIVNKMEEPSDPITSKNQPISFPSDQISKGRAERMDYQKLFDQLRDISNSKE